MARLLLGLAVVVVVATIYAVIDCAMIANDRVRGLSKPVWLVVILLIPVIGLLLWFFIGRGRAGRTAPAQRLAPDDDPAFTGESPRRFDPEQDERIRKLEEELAALDAEFDLPPMGSSPRSEGAADPDRASQPKDTDGGDRAPKKKSKSNDDTDGVAPEALNDSKRKRDDRGDAADA